MDVIKLKRKKRAASGRGRGGERTMSKMHVFSLRWPTALIELLYILMFIVVIALHCIGAWGRRFAYIQLAVVNGCRGEENRFDLNYVRMTLNHF